MMLSFGFSRVTSLLAVVMVLFVFASTGCAGDSVAGPYCGVIKQDDVTSIVSRVETVEDERSSVMGCRIHGQRGILVA